MEHLANFLPFILSGIGGAAIGLIGSVVTQHFNNRRELRNWRRDKIYEAYLGLTTAIIEVKELWEGAQMDITDPGISAERLSSVQTRSLEMAELLRDASAPIILLGPASLEQKLAVFAQAIHSGDNVRYSQARNDVLATLRAEILGSQRRNNRARGLLRNGLM